MKTYSLLNIALRAALIIGQLSLSTGLAAVALIRPQLPDGLSELQSFISTPQQALAANNAPASRAASNTASTTSAFAFAPVQITGMVFSDYNSDGLITANGIVTDTGVPSVTVTVRDDLGNLVSTVSSASGHYTITPSFNGPYRVEFTNLPSGYEPAAAGTQNGTSVQLIKTAAQATGVNFGVLEPCDYCQNNPSLATTRLTGYEYPRDLASPAILSFSSSSVNTPAPPFVSFNTVITPPTPNQWTFATPMSTLVTMAIQSEVGNVFGLAWHRATQTLFSSAFARAAYRTNGGTNPGGLGAIYMTKNATTTLFATVANVGTFGGFGNEAGLVGLGDLELSRDGNTLYAVNIYSHTLISIPVNGSIPTAGLQTITPLPVPADCPATNIHAFALGRNRDKLYVGMTCDGIGAAELIGYVYEYDGVSFTQKIRQPFNYARPNINASYYGALGYADYQANNMNFADWDYYADYWDTSNDGATPKNFVGFAIQPKSQPWLVDIEFDHGDMLLGIRSRYGDARLESFWVTGGDLLRACADSPINPTAWTMESNGSCGGKTMTIPSVDPYTGRSLATGFDSPTFGIGGQAYYWGNIGWESKSGTGALAQIPGYGVIYGSAVDVLSHNNEHGIMAVSHESGAITGSGHVFYSGFDNYDGIRKGNALGDIEALCNPAPLEIGNRVWYDLDGDGVQDAGESGIAGLQVSLQSPTGTVGTVTTDSEGNYYFGNLAPNTNYTVTLVTSPAGYRLTQANAAALSGASVSSNHAISDVLDSDAVLVGGLATISYTTGTAGQNNHGLDFGVYLPAALGDYVWSDLDADGQQEAGEPGVNGVTVTLYSNGVPISTTSTFNYLGTDGYYTFTNLISGTYSVTFGLPAGFAGFTTPNSGADATDSDAVLVTPILAATGNYVLFPGDQQITVDAGLVQPAGLGDRVWEDFNHNGVQDAGEPGVANVTVTLQTPTGTLTTVTNPSGLYSFTNLIPGVPYTVSFTAPDGYTFTVPNATVNTNDSNVTTPNGGTPSVTLGANEFNPTIDAGLWRPLSLGNRVWEDYNNDGLLGAGEPGVANVPVVLLNSSGAVISTTTTNASGFYTFTNLISGTYVVSITAPAGYRSSSDIGSSGAPDNNIDSDDNGLGTGTGVIVSNPITLIPGTEPTTDDVSEGLTGNTSTNWTVDFGIWRPAILGDYVWSDLDADGQQDVGEPGVRGVTVTLYQNGVPISTTTTDAAGGYLFTNLLSGTYSVTFGLPAGFVGFTTPNSGNDVTDSDANIVTGATGNYVLFPGDAQLTVDAGLIPSAGLGDLVWYDIDHDGVQDTGEPGIPNMTVTLETPTGTLTTTTDANGIYTFTNLTPGVPYTVVFTAPNGYTFTLPMVGTPATDSNVNPGTGTVPPVTLTPGQFDPTIDAGLWMPPPTLVLQKTAATSGGAVRSGDLVTYTMVARNDGPGIAVGVVISDPLPAGLEYIAGSAVPVAQVNGQLLVWTKPTLGVGERFTMTFVTRVRPSAQLSGTQILNLGYAFATSPENELVPLPATIVEDEAQVNVPFVPTAVVLTLFRADWLNQVNAGSAVHAAWETGSEINTFGFSLYRSADGTRASAVLVTPQLIRSTSVNNGGASYSFDDLTAQPGTTYTYWLQEQETTGVLNEYGPVDTSGRQLGLHNVQRLFMPVLMH